MTKIQNAIIGNGKGDVFNFEILKRTSAMRKDEPSGATEVLQRFNSPTKPTFLKNQKAPVSKKPLFMI